MNGIDLTDRFINDIKIAIQAKSIVRSLSQQKIDTAKCGNNRDFDLNYSYEETIISVSCEISILGYIEAFINYLNYPNIILKLEPRDSETLNTYLSQFDNQKDVIANHIQLLKENNRIIFKTTTDEMPFFDLILNRLNYIHSESNLVNKCYQRLINKKIKNNS